MYEVNEREVVSFDLYRSICCTIPSKRNFLKKQCDLAVVRLLISRDKRLERDYKMISFLPFSRMPSFVFSASHLIVHYDQLSSLLVGIVLEF